MLNHLEMFLNDVKYKQFLGDAKMELRSFIHEFWSDQKLAEVYAFNADGKMSYRNMCCCLIGVTDSDTLHNVYCGDSLLFGSIPSDHHYHQFKNRIGARAEIAEGAYMMIARHPPVQIVPRVAAWMPLDDELGQRRFSAIMRAEMRRRARAANASETLSAARVTEDNLEYACVRMS
jgi:hypothetical protein